MDVFSKLNHKVEESDLRPGDHIYCYRLVRSYSHHGIYVGKGKVIHFLDNNESAARGSEGPISGFSKFSTSSGGRSTSPGEECGTNNNGGVQLIDIQCFLKGHTLRRFYYEVSKTEFALNLRGGCSGLKAEESGKVLHNAWYLLETHGFGTYNLRTHNCEDFAIYCMTGMIDEKNGKSKQIELIRLAIKKLSSISRSKKKNLKLLERIKTFLEERWKRDREGTHYEVEDLVKMYKKQT